MNSGCYIRTPKRHRCCRRMGSTSMQVGMLVVERACRGNGRQGHTREGATTERAPSRNSGAPPERRRHPNLQVAIAFIRNKQHIS
jgi:hypothetical protein